MGGFRSSSPTNIRDLTTSTGAVAVVVTTPVRSEVASWAPKPSCHPVAAMMWSFVMS